MTCARQLAQTKRRPDAGIGNPRQCRCDIDRADGACNTLLAPYPVVRVLGSTPDWTWQFRPVSGLFLRR
jgi:hypothetical protein